LQALASLILQTPLAQVAGARQCGPFASSHAAPSAAGASQVPVAAPVPVLQVEPPVQTV
jgi:hypothetical protein